MCQILLTCSLACVLIVLIELAKVQSEANKAILQSEQFYFPDNVPYFTIRKDIVSGEAVQRGLLNKVVSSLSEKTSDAVSYDEFTKALQCAPIETDLNGRSGTWSMLKLATPSIETVERICAWCEAPCDWWVECAQDALKLRTGGYSNNLQFIRRFGQGRELAMLRITNSRLYYDWPWGNDRFRKKDKDFRDDLVHGSISLIDKILRAINDLGDSVFFKGGEQSVFPWMLPFPCFTFSPSMSSGDLPFPWYVSYADELQRYQHASRNGGNYSDSFYQRQQKQWLDRADKAVFSGSWQSTRHLLFDQAILRPDLFEVSFTMAARHHIQPWNPNSNEPIARRPDLKEYNKFGKKYNADGQKPGYIQSIASLEGEREYVAGRYKFVIVMQGTDGRVASSRLAELLAHSGAVILLQASTFSSHFSSRLLPWVHYVPISYSGADLIAKLLWLRENDDMAQRIAQNAVNFGKSYLRLEDYYCYVATTFKSLSELQHGTNVTQGFDPQLILRPEEYSSVQSVS